MKMIEKNELKISSTLFEFINNEAIPGTNVDSDKFWSNFSKIVHELTPINKNLIKNRESIQKKIDDCFKLNNNLVKFSTPDYNLTLSIDSSPAFVHVFNPNFEELLAIELTSGISNSFIHNKGLDILKSGNSREVNWELYLE